MSAPGAALPIPRQPTSTRRYDLLRSETLALFPQVIGAARHTGRNETERRLIAARDRLVEGKLTVLVCGEFKRGKSSLINALLGERNLLPVNEHAATSIVTTIRYGTRERILVHIDRPGRKTEILERKRSSLPSYLTHTGNPGNTIGVRLVEIEIPCELLVSGLTLVDTPGVGGVYAAHTAATLEILPEADAVIFVTDAVMPLTESEMRFVRQAAETASLLDDEDALLFVLTKIDIPASYATILANTSEKIADLTGWPADRVRVVPVSSRAKLNYISSQDEIDLRVSNFAELDRLIWAALHRRQCKVLLGDALRDLDLSAGALLQPIEDEIEFWRSRTSSTHADPDQVYAARLRELGEIEAADASWRRELAEKVGEFCREAERNACAEVQKIAQRVNDAYLVDDDLMRDRDKLTKWLVDDVVEVVARLDEILAKDAARVQREFAMRSDINLGESVIGRLPELPISAIAITGIPGKQQPGGTFHKIWANSPRFRSASTAGVIIGRLIGTAAAPGVGTFVGQAVGGLIGGIVGGAFDLRAVRRQAAGERTTWRRELQEDLDQFLARLRRHIEQGVTEVSSDFTRTITAELDSRIIQRRESAEESVQRAHDSFRRNMAHARERLAELATERAPLDRLRDRVAELAWLANDLGDHDGTSQSGGQAPAAAWPRSARTDLSGGTGP